ncbi:hypothetical protein Lalb_Chr02g0147561 [Lupinus albus]|uniref:Uncharacterized protein n=1 Tax=Lupinus albus TaxID=3870 RepID=A0A6A4R0N2_LUPAL|nr:hypothetical protein Lalb_Chr02g0147561 [Lupinus albus]
MSPPGRSQHFTHLKYSIMVPLLNPFNPTLKPINKFQNRWNHQLRAIIPIPNPSTLRSQTLPILMRYNRMMQILTLQRPASV